MGILDSFLRLLGAIRLYKSRSGQAMVSESNQTLTDINSEYLYQHWLHSREEQQQTDTDELYRPKDFKKFPPSRFRMEYIFYRNGDCEWYYLAPNDAHHFKSGKWRTDPNDKSILQIIIGETTVSFRVTELRKDKLRLVRIRSNP
jgi:hypothetical protein